MILYYFVVFGARTEQDKTLIALRQKVIKRRKPVNDFAPYENAVKTKAIIQIFQHFEHYPGWIYWRHCRAVETNGKMWAVNF